MRLLYRNDMGLAEVATVSCDADPLSKLRVPRADDKEDCPPAPMPALSPHQKLPQNYAKGGEQVMTAGHLY